MIRTFRLTGRPHEWPLTENLLRAQGFEFTPLPYYPGARALVREPVPLGASLAARFGYIYIQDASSMLPALALASLMSKKNGAAGPLCLLDMCASPGGKAGLLSLLAGEQSLTLANDPSPKRLATLRRNLEHMNAFGCGSISFPGEALPLPSAAHGNDAAFTGFDHILLDPPCSGWGTAEKHPQVLTLWQGDKIRPLVALQRLLLREAVRLLKPGGFLSYSTCTVNAQENDEQIRWVLTEFDAELGGGILELVPLSPFAGFSFDASMPGCEGTLNVSRKSPLGQGFYLAALRKSPTATALMPSQHTVGRQRSKSGQKLRPSIDFEAKYLEVSILNTPLLDSLLLPPGRIMLQHNTICFMPAAGHALPENFTWRGFPLGKSAEGALRQVSGLRGLMPAPEKARQNGAAILQVEEPAPVLALVSGQSQSFASTSPEVGLYYKNLPLCRLKARGGRIFM